VCVFDPFIELIIILVMGTIMVGMGGVIGLRWVSMHSLDRKFVNNKVNQYKELADEYKKEASRWRGKASKNFQNMQVEGDYDLTSADGIGDVVKTLLPNLLSILPPEIQSKAKGLLDNPAILEMAVKLYKDNPDVIKSLLAKFVKKGSTTESGDKDFPSTSEEIKSYA